MPDSTATLCRSLIDTSRYPIDDLESPARDSAIERCRSALAIDGCAVLPGFLSDGGLSRLLDEARERRSQAYFSPQSAANVYFSADDPNLAIDHPRRIFFKRTNGFITSDCFDERTAAYRLYHWSPLTRFIAECLGKETLYLYDDPVSNMIVNVSRRGSEFTWHFDTNEFTITLLLQPAASGGRFEYVPNLRTPVDEKYDDVRRVLAGDRTRLVQLDLRPGDLQLFLGRFSLHRVTENTGTRDRLLLIMSFTDRPGMVGSLHRVKSLYGKITQAHIDGEKHRIRSDTLAD